MKSFGNPFSSNVLAIIFTSVLDVLKLSFPPLKIKQFPDFNAIQAASIVTFGRDS